MINFSGEAKVKLETLKPAVSKILKRQITKLDGALSRLMKEGKIKPIVGLDNSYIFRANPTYRIIFENSGQDVIISDIINITSIKAGNAALLRSTSKENQPALSQKKRMNPIEKASPN